MKGKERGGTLEGKKREEKESARERRASKKGGSVEIKAKALTEWKWKKPRVKSEPAVLE